MSKKTLSASVVAVAMLALMASTALAGPYGNGRGMGPNANAPQLTQEQIAKIEQDRAAFLQGTADLRKQIAVKRVELQTAMAQAKPDQEKFKALSSELIDLRAQLAKERVKYMGDDVSAYGPGFCNGRGGKGGFGRGGQMGMFGGRGGGNCWQ